MNTTVTPASHDLSGAALASGLSVREIQKAIAQGDLTPHYRGTKPLILHSDLVEWVESLPTTKKSGA